MDDPLLVRGLERLPDLTRDGEGFVDRQGPLRDAFGERLALDELQHERRHAAGVFESVDPADVGMVQRREQLRLALESRQPFRIPGHRFRENLDGDIAVQLRVPRPVDLAHASRAERRQDFVGAEACARG